MISGDVNIVDYEMAEFRDEIIDVATILYHKGSAGYYGWENNIAMGPLFIA